MSQQNQFTMSARLKSFIYAFNGIKYYFKHQHNVWIHLLIAFVVIAFGLLFNINSLQWCLVFLAMGMVLSAEGFNSAVELLSDIVSPDQNSRIGQVKDIAAGAVLLTAFFAAIVGLIIFLPKIWQFINSLLI